MPFTHYIVFGNDKRQMNQEEDKKAWSEYGQALKKYNLKLTGPFGPFGVPEGGAFILEGSYCDFEKYIGSEAFNKCPLTNTRTISLWKVPYA